MEPEDTAGGKESSERPFTVIFVMLLIMGKETAYHNLRRVVDASKAVRARWITIEMEPSEWFARLPITGSNHSLRYGLTARSRVLNHLRTEGLPDVAFFNHPLPALFLRRFRGRVPCVDSLDVTPASLYTDGQAYYPVPRKEGAGLPSRLKRAWVASIYRNSKKILPYSGYTRRSLIEDYGVNPSQIAVFPPGVDVGFWIPPIGSRTHVRPFTVLFVGNDFLRKGGDALLAAAGSEECRGMQFVVASNATVGPTPPNVTVVRQAARNSEAIRDLYARADVFLMPTRGDFGPTNAISEALAMALPVLTHDVGGIGETVRDGIEGFHVSPDDPGSIIRGLVRLRDDRDTRARMSAAARRRAEETLDVGVNGVKLIEYLREAKRSGLLRPAASLRRI
jgi:glycosyltransferase involved in cell wall biosynthesis